MISAKQVSAGAATYLKHYPEDTERVAPLAAASATGTDLTARTTLPGHLTCSAVLVNGDGHVLHIRHNTLGAWLRPGGHIEREDTDLLRAALRELAEETGIHADQVEPLAAYPIDVDVHAIPANPAKAEPGHDHYDLRYAFVVPGRTPVTLQEEEVNAYAWLPIEQLGAPLAARIPSLLLARR